MKILVATIETPGNGYLNDLIEALSKHVEVIHDCNKFWECSENFDIVHIHWPEYLSYELETYLYNDKEFSDDLWERINFSLKYWYENSKIVYTRHNILPHKRKDKDFIKLYDQIISTAHTIVHFTDYSISEFNKRYPNRRNANHVVIPHHNYASLPNTITKKIAREEFGIQEDDIVMLVFGAIRGKEKKLVLKAFECIEQSKKRLLAPKLKIKNSYENFPVIGSLSKFINKKVINKNLIYDLGHIPEKDVQYYMKASDFMFIPRDNELNSGIIYLGATFGVVMVGIENENIGKILSQTGNIIFEKDNKNSLKTSIGKAIEKSKSDFSEHLREMALKLWKVDNIVTLYLNVFKA